MVLQVVILHTFFYCRTPKNMMANSSNFDFADCHCFKGIDNKILERYDMCHVVGFIDWFRSGDADGNRTDHSVLFARRHGLPDKVAFYIPHELFRICHLEFHFLRLLSKIQSDEIEAAVLLQQVTDT